MLKEPILSFSGMLFFVVVACSGCSTMLVSPLGTTSSPYIPLPSVAGPYSSNIVTYAATTITAGAPMEPGNYEDSDLFFGGMLGQGVGVGHFRARYNINLSTGVYVAAKEPSLGSAVDAIEDAYRQNSGGSMFAGMIGTHGGICYASQFKQGKIEWRIIGVEASISKEFGEYINFRKNYPAGRVDYIETRDWQYSIGIFSEFVRFIKRDKHFGFKYAIGAGTLGAFIAAPVTGELKVYNTEGLPQYFAVTSFFGNKKIDGYAQLNFGPMFHVNLGVLFNLSKH